MKNTLKFAALFLFVSLSLISCSKDDDGPSTSGNLVGQWEFFKEGELVDGNEYLELYEHSAGCEKDQIEFNADGTFEGTSYDTDCIGFSSTGFYVKDGNKITTDFGEVIIKQLDGSTLKVYETYQDEGETFTDITVFKRIN